MSKLNDINSKLSNALHKAKILFKSVFTWEIRSKLPPFINIEDIYLLLQ